MAGDRIAVLVNTDSGGRWGADRLDAALRDAGLAARAVRLTAETLVPELRAASARAGVLAVGGGDGTLRTAAEVLAGTGTALVPVPLERAFLNTATFGFYASMLARRESWRRFLGRWPAAVLALGRELADLVDFEVELLHARHLLLRSDAPLGATLDGEVFDVTTPVYCSIDDGGLCVLVE